MSANPIELSAGRTDFDSVDRLAIHNLIHSYAIEVDEYDLDAWFRLFTPEAVFTTIVPGQPDHSMCGSEMEQFWRKRMGAFEELGYVRRHLITNVQIKEQTETDAHAIISALLLSVKAHHELTVVTPIIYEGWFIKADGVWCINRWNDSPDMVMAE